MTGYFPCHWVVPVDFPNTGLWRK